MEEYLSVFKINILENFTNINTNRIIVLGDIHGDWELTIKLLKIGNVIDDKLQWIGNNTIVVQMGDQIDRCRPTDKLCKHPLTTMNDENSDIKILKFFSELHNKAKINGGAVYSLLGNHEIMNILGDFRYVSHNNIKSFDNNINIAITKRQEFFKRGGEFAKYLAETRISLLQIGKHLFVHGGLMPSIAQKYTISQINNIVKQWLIDPTFNDVSTDEIIHGINSPFWNRSFGILKPNCSMDNNICKDLFSKTCELYNIDNIIIGHSIQSYDNHSGINSTCDNRIWRTDVGASKAMDQFGNNPNRKPQILEIFNDSFNILT
jgi:hypothetical protein